MTTFLNPARHMSFASLITPPSSPPELIRTKFENAVMLT